MPAEPAWEIEVRWCGEGEDPRAQEIRRDLEDWLSVPIRFLEVHRLFYLEAEGLDRGRVERCAAELLTDPVNEEASIRALEDHRPPPPDASSQRLEGGAALHIATVFKRPGVMEPVEGSLVQGLRDLGVVEAGEEVRVRTALRVVVGAALDAEARRIAGEKVLSNPVIEEVYWDDDPLPSPFARAAPYRFHRVDVPLHGLSDEDLLALSRTRMLALNLAEMRAIQDHFRALGRAPTDAELETLAQTWSEHCCHKTFNAAIEHNGETIDNLFRSTIRRATEEVLARRNEPFCLSVFEDNAGVIAFDEDFGISFKVETHNHPSAIEPYGGAGTGIGGVLRDTMGTGLGAKPIVNTDVFCFAPPWTPKEAVPAGALHPLRVLRGVVAGVRDYGNRMGIPTASGALYFDERYIGNPLVYCGSAGILPRWAVRKEVRPGDLIFVLGGRTGRDGIHGATFSSAELNEESEAVAGGAVQIGNPITEKKVLDVLLQARDRKLYRSVTDCGAGGLSSAVGEMGRRTGARVDLERVPLKYEGLSYTEIWISEAQERMVLAVPPEHREALLALARSEDVECTEIGVFTGTGRLELFYEGNQVADLDMTFLHEGRPKITLRSRFERPPAAPLDLRDTPAPGKLLHAILASPNVASKEWVIRQYDHEVQGGAVLKPLQGPRTDGPGDGVVFAPRPGSVRGVAIGCGMNPCYGDLDPRRMALSAVDEAVRNAVAAGADPERLAVLDNFSWGDVSDEATLGALVEAARGCYEAAVRLDVPFISGKDSLNNVYRTRDGVISIPPSLLVSSVGLVPDIRRCTSMDLKRPGNVLVLAGATACELGGSHLARVLGREGGEVPDLPAEAREIHKAVHRAVREGLAHAIHDLSEGGLAVAAAEMGFAGGVGVEIELACVPHKLSPDTPLEVADLVLLFSESNCRYLIEAAPEDAERLLSLFSGLPAARIGHTIEYGILRVKGSDGRTLLAESLEELERSWKAPLDIDGTLCGAGRGRGRRSSKS